MLTKAASPAIVFRAPGTGEGIDGPGPFHWDPAALA